MEELEEYLKALRLGLSVLGPEKADDIASELRSHVTESAEASGRPLEDVLGGLGPADALAHRYLEELGLSDAGEGSPGGPSGGQGEAQGDSRSQKSQEEQYAGHRRFFFGVESQLAEELGRMGREFGKKMEELNREMSDLGQGLGQGLGSGIGQVIERAMEWAGSDAPPWSEHGPLWGETLEYVEDIEASEGLSLKFAYANLSIMPRAEPGFRIVFKLRGEGEACKAWRCRVDRQAYQVFVGEAVPQGSGRPKVWVESILVEMGPECRDCLVSLNAGNCRAEGLALSSLSLSSLGGNIKVGGLRAELSLSTQAGNIDLSDVEGELRAGSQAGNIQLEGWKGSHPAKLSTQAGNIGVSLTGQEPSMRLKSGLGRVRVGGTSHGTEYRLEIPGLEWLEAETSVGNVTIDMA